MRITADENIPGLDETFGRFGTILRCKGREISPSDVQEADVLLVRSISRVDEALLAGSSVSFVGSATIGIDHMDTGYLQRSGIKWCHSPGCNADAASQYTLAMILLACKRQNLDLAGMKAGIVGFGNVGSRLYSLLSLVGIQEVSACDPPLANAGQPGLAGIREIMDCDLISFHVPLTKSGPNSTMHMGNQDFFSQLKPKTLVVNSSRGAVLESKALNDWLKAENGHVALDVWPDEPSIESTLLDQVTVATPHVAGYSLDGKLNGTRMLFRQFLDWQALSMEPPLPPHAPQPENMASHDLNSLESAILTACPVEEDDQQLRSCMRSQGRIQAAEFDNLRKNYRSRRDFAGKLLPENCPEQVARALKALGFSQSSH